MNLFAMADPRPIHFMRIAVAGISWLALLARQQCVAVTGCDSDPSGAADLAAAGVEIWRGHDPGHVAGARAVVVTAAVAGDHPELERARALGFFLSSRRRHTRCCCVTGVQTCALPICHRSRLPVAAADRTEWSARGRSHGR